MALLSTHIALLRAVNLAGRGMVAMSDLRATLEAMGYSDVRTVLQSGNLVFRTTGGRAEKLETLIEQQLLKRLGIETDVLVRSRAQWKALIAGNPFADEASRDPGHLLAVVSKTPVSKESVAALQAAVVAAGGRETVAESGGRLYAYYPDGVGRSRLTTALVERTLGTRVTGRNWNTALKLAQAASTVDR
jgi:uncharacterized protein (DUF1697 family)